MMLFCCQSNIRSKTSTIKKGTATMSYNKRAFDGEASRLGACAKFPVNINQYSPANFNDVDSQQLINEPEMFPFNWERVKKNISQGYTSVADPEDLCLGPIHT